MIYNSNRGVNMEELRDLIEVELMSCFVKEKVDLSADNVQAAMVTAAIKMANSSNIISEHQTEEKLVTFLSDDAKKMVGMGPQYVKSIIGYSVDFNDYTKAASAYISEKDKYDKLYKDIKSYDLENTKQM